MKRKQNVDIDEKFKFQDITPNEMKTYVHKLDPMKACIENDFPARILIGSSEISSNYLSSIYSRTHVIRILRGPRNLFELHDYLNYRSFHT